MLPNEMNFEGVSTQNLTKTYTIENNEKKKLN